MSGRTAGQLPGLDIAEAKSWQHYLESVLCFHAVQNRLLDVEHQLSVVDLQVLDVLSKSTTGSARMGALAEALEVRPPHLTKRIRRLRVQALVRQEPSPEDKRGKFAIVTDAGREAASQATVTYARGVRAHLIDPLSRPQIVALEESCRRLNTRPVQALSALPACQLPGLDDIEARCWRQFVDSSERLLATVNSTLVATHQLTMSDVVVLYILATCDQATRLSVLARSLMLIPSRVSQQINRLELRGLVSRTPSPGDKRGVHIDITGQGRARARPAIETYAQAIRTHYLDPLSRPQMIALGDTCRRISTPLKSASTPTEPQGV